MARSRIHRVDGCRREQAAVPEASTAEPSRRARILRPARTRDSLPAGATGAGARDQRLLVLPLLVQRAAHVGPALSGGARVWTTRFPFRTLLGKRKLVQEMARLDGRDAP